MSNENPLVSIVMRTKDREILLKRAILNCANQSYKNFELIIVNDGGDAASVDRLLQKAESKLLGRATVIHNPQSKGMEHASNQAITASKGKYIAIHDDDDCWDSQFLKKTVSYLEENPHAGGVAVRTEIVLEQIIDNTWVEEVGREPAWPEIHQFSLSRLMLSNIAVPISCLYPRKVIEDLGGFRSDLPVVGDWEFHLRLASKYQVGFLDGAPLAFWHQRRAQTGVLGNSVFAGADSHSYFDLKVRDEHLKDYVAHNGIGALLWQAAMFKELRQHQEAAIFNELRQQQETAFGWFKHRAKSFIERHFKR